MDVMRDGNHPSVTAEAVSPVTSPGLGLLLRQAEQIVRRAMAEPLAELDLTAEQWRVMAALLEEPGQTMSALADAAVLPGGTLTRHIDHLVERGLVLRRVHVEDRRRVAAVLSPRGRAVAQRLRAREVGVEDEIRERVGEGLFDAGVGSLRALLG